MSYYINPPDRSKEQWLLENGRSISHWSNITDGEHPVCLVNNGPFTAAGIAYNRAEAETFAHPCGRPKHWYAVPDDKLIEVEPSVANALKAINPVAVRQQD